MRGDIRIARNGSRDFVIIPTNAQGILTWDCPSPGIYNFIHLSNRLLSQMRQTIIFPLPDKTGFYAGSEGWIIGDWDLSEEDNYPRLFPFGLCLGNAICDENDNIINTEDGDVLFLVDETNIYYEEESSDNNNENN
jgi:hypothetical protein